MMAAHGEYGRFLQIRMHEVTNPNEPFALTNFILSQPHPVWAATGGEFAFQKRVLSCDMFGVQDACSMCL